MTTTPIITPEVRAAIERFRTHATSPSRRQSPYWRCPCDDAEYFDEPAMRADAMTLAHVLLSLFPPGMPLSPMDFYGEYDREHIDPRTLYRQPIEDGDREVHGVFFPLKIVEPRG